ncbi:MAG: methionyl-tRNA formyltransferase [Candidatus Poribacteria bacterium]|nr:methionyl-tRNA formyltransferase [Candidatus Poribacteria bacterium]MDE0503696.1 methionyl-tRNA formyltransferase [Candidatus Poribacteria bacterium]
MRIVFMGTSEFSIPSLQALVTQHFDIVAVVTQPDRPSGRGKRLMPPPVKVAAAQLHLTVYQPERLRRPDFIRTLRNLRPNAIVVVAFGQLIPKAVLDLPPCGCINVHPSLLPKYRGAAPIQWALINGEEETGVTIMLLDETEDTGDIILQRRVMVDPLEDAAMLSHRLACAAAKTLVQVLQATPSDAPPPHTPQNHDDATHAPKLTKESGRIDWNAPAVEICNLVRGTAVWPGAFTYFNGELRLKILQCHVIVDSRQCGNVPGIVTVTPQRDLIIGTGTGVLKVTQVQPANKRIMDAKEFVNGYRVKSGTCFSQLSRNG